MNSVDALPPQRARVACPCCGYLTLTAIAAYEVCSLCYWEDYGQDTAHAAEVWSGPNHGYALAEARRSFEAYLSMYPPEEDLRFVGGDSPHTKNIKQSLIATFHRMRNETTPEAMIALWHEVERREQELFEETTRRVEAGDE